MPQPRRGSSPAASRGSSQQLVKNYGPWVLAGALVLGFGGLIWFAKSRSTPIDETTLCRTDQTPPSLTAMLIDASDSLSANERAQVLSEIERIQSSVPRFGLLEVYALRSDVDGPPSPIFSICNPGRGSEVSEIYQNPTLVERRWRDGFESKLDESLAAVVTAPDSDRSMIMETIKALSVAPMGAPKFDGVPKTLVVFSDFIQNTPGLYSQYRRPIDSHQAFSGSDFGSRMRANMQGVDVDLFYIDRPSTHALQDGEHQRFWVDYFQANGARVQHMKRIFGD